MNDLNDIYIHIRRRIIDHEFEPGSKLNQRILAEEYGTSSTPVIKALHRLASEGIVDNIQNRGFVVHTSNIKELADLYELREALEVIAVADIVSMEDCDREAICAELYQIMETMKNADSECYRKADVLFHNKIIAACSNEMLKNINDSHQILNRTYLSGLLRSQEETMPEHQKILDAIRNHDLEHAREAMRTHIGVTKDAMSKLIQHLQWIGLNPKNIIMDDLIEKKLPISDFQNK